MPCQDVGGARLLAWLVGNKLPTLHGLLFFLFLVFIVVIRDDIDCGLGYFERNFDDFDAQIDGIADNETEATR